LNAALAKSQKEMKSVEKNADNPHFKSKFADLATVYDYALPILAKNGLSITHRYEMFEDVMVCIAELRHESGESVESVWPIGKVGLRQQEIASGSTYARRYTFMGLSGVSARDEDDDGNAASGKETSPPKPPPKNFAPSTMDDGPLFPPEEPPPPQKKKTDDLTALCKEKKISGEEIKEIMKEVFGTTKGWSQLTDGEVTILMTHIKQVWKQKS